MSGLYEAIGKTLGGSPVLGVDLHSEGDLARIVRERLPLESLRALESRGWSRDEITTLIIPARTLRRRASRKERLSQEESDRTIRLLRIESLAEEAFGDPAKARRWLRRPLVEVGRESPLQVARTEAGARLIESILAKIAWGAAA